VKSPLQTAPLALLEAFGLRTLGDNPREFSGEVMPVTDVTEQYLAQRRETLQAVEAGVAASQHSATISITVPTIIYAANLQLSSGTSLAALQWIDGMIRFRPRQDGQWTPLATWWEWYAAAITYPLVGHQWKRSHHFPVPLLAAPGSQIQGFFESNVTTAADGAAALNLLAVRLNPS